MVLTASGLQFVFHGFVVQLYVAARTQSADGQWTVILLQPGDTHGKRRHLRGVGTGLSAEAALQSALAGVAMIP